MTRDKSKFYYFRDFLDYFREKIIPERELSDSYKRELFRKISIIKSVLGKQKPKNIDLFLLSQFLNDNAKTPRMFNQYRSLFHDIFVEMMDNGVVIINIAKLKKPKKQTKSRLRLSVAQYQAIYLNSPSWLQTAMALSLQTSHGRAEIVNLKYSDLVDGYLRIHRKKTQKYPSSFVEIPIGFQLDSIIKQSRDDLVSPFIVHTKPLKITQARISLDHWTQITPEQLTRKFKAVRDSLELFDNIDMKKRPTFHEIRALSIWLGERSGHDMKARAGHSDRKMTERYILGHETQWNRVENMEIDIEKIGRNERI